MTDLREKIANIIPLSLLDGRDRHNNVFEVADDILALLRAEGVMLPNQTRRVRYNYGGDAVWIAEEYAPGWWRIQGWNGSAIPERELDQDFTNVDDD